MLGGKEVGYVRRTGDGKMLAMITTIMLRMMMMMSRWKKGG